MTGDATPTEASGVPIYGAFVAGELAAQEVRKASFEQRGLAVVTTSGVLVTLLLGLTAVATREASTFVLPTTVTYLLVGALVAFLFAAVTALSTNLPFRYAVATADDLRARLKEEPVRDQTQAQLDIALSGIKALRRAKIVNNRKGWLLFSGISCERLALGQLGTAVGLVVLR